MAYSDNISRLSRLTSILLQLQSKSFVKVSQLADQFKVSKRTIYRDLAALEQAGIPILQQENKGFSLMADYNIPPVMFTETEANALIFGEKLIAKTKDESLINEFNSAIDKIKSVLNNNDKEKIELLSDRTIIGKNWHDERTSNHLSDVQKALTNFQVVQLNYLKAEALKPTIREVEPFAIYHNTSENWVLIAWCRLRSEFRNFRIDRIQKLVCLSESFTPHKLTLEEYVEILREKHFNKTVTKG
ncbi:MAG: helix-turn-helix transcriptional regulator [Crocinitomicaceae bacterium]